jgi:hypothetical protein
MTLMGPQAATVLFLIVNDCADACIRDTVEKASINSVCFMKLIFGF